MDKYKVPGLSKVGGFRVQGSKDFGFKVKGV